MKKIPVLVILILLVFLTSVVFSASAQESAGEISTVTPASDVDNILPALTPYPTSVSDLSKDILQKYTYTEIQTVSANGIQISVANFRVENNAFMTDMCHQNLDHNEWTVGLATIEFGDQKIFITSAAMLDINRIFEDGSKETIESTDKLTQSNQENINEKYQAFSYRCDTLSFNLPPETPLTEVKLTIQYINASLPLSVGCFEQIETVQYLLDINNAGIQVGCVKSEFENMTPSSFVILEKPESLTMDEAMKIVTTTSNDLSRVYGPWVFTGQVMQDNKIDLSSPEETEEEIIPSATTEITIPTP